ncbi:TRAP transporter small permease [Tomitella biformata]|uniref:TRAP transporter small permease n=1 Tax=Tomitella biformata TaxID=630403 RepID=UPI00046480E9|nr:TRAP transporter small permease [Tomitella biformata]
MSTQVLETIVHAEGRGAGQRTTFGYLTPDHPRLDRFQNGISAFCAAISGIAVVLIALLTVAEVVARVLFSTPLGWNVGFVEQYLMMAIAFFGTVTAYRSGAHVAVTSIFEKTPVIARKMLLIVAYIVIILGLVFFIYSGTRAANFSFITDEAPPPGMADLSWPTWWWKSIIPVAAILGLIVVAIDLFRELTAPLKDVVTDYEAGEIPEGH